MMALAADHRGKAAEKLLGSMRRFADTPHNSTAETMRPVTIPVCEAILAYRDKAYERAVDLLWPIRGDWQRLGASHAQRDILVQILLDAALKAGRIDQARDVVAERDALRPESIGFHQRWSPALQAAGIVS